MRPRIEDQRPSDTADLSIRLEYIINEIHRVGFDSALTVFQHQLDGCVWKDEYGNVRKKHYLATKEAMRTGPYVQFLKVVRELSILYTY